MANNFEAYEKLAENFNNKYKVNFSFKKYDSQRLNKKNICQLKKLVKLMKKYDLAGLAAWRLGFEKTGTWDLIKRYVN